MKRIIKLEGKKAWDYTYYGEDFSIDFKQNELDEFCKEGKIQVMRDNFLYTLTVKETEKCIFYDIEREMLIMEDTLVCDLKEEKMLKKDFYGKVYSFFRVYESEEEEFFLFGSYDDNMNIVWYMPMRNDDEYIYYKLVKEELLSKYELKNETRMMGILLDLSTNKSMFDSPSTIDTECAFKRILIEKKYMCKWASRELDFCKMVYVEDDNNRQYLFRHYKNNYFDFVTYTYGKLEEAHLTGFKYKINRKMRKIREEGIIKELDNGGVFAWLNY